MTGFSDNGTCNICNLSVVLVARLSELEARLFTIENHPITTQVPLIGAKPSSVANPVKRESFLSTVSSGPLRTGDWTEDKFRCNLSVS